MQESIIETNGIVRTIENTEVIKMEKIYRLIDKQGNVLFEGTYEECAEKEKDKLVYVGISTPIYRATNNNGVDITGTMSSLAKTLNMKYVTLYNYTRYKRQGDGLFLEKVGNKIVS